MGWGGAGRGSGCVRRGGGPGRGGGRQGDAHLVQAILHTRAELALHIMQQRQPGTHVGQRNAVALGNALAALPAGDTRRAPLQAALQARAEHPSALVREHVQWALGR